MSRSTQAEKKSRGKTRSAPEQESGRAPSRASRTPDPNGSVRRTATGVTAPVTAEPSSGRRSGKPRPAERDAEAKGKGAASTSRSSTRKAAAVRKSETPSARPVKRKAPTRAVEDEHRSKKSGDEPPAGETPGREESAESPPRHAPKRGPREKQGEEVGALDPEPTASGRQA